MSDNEFLFLKPVLSADESDSMDEYNWLVELIKTAKRGCGAIEDGEWTADGYLHVNECSCGEERAGSYNYLFPNNMITDSLCLHFLEFHRAEISNEDFVKLEQLKNNVQFKKCSQCKKFKSTLGNFKRCQECRDKASRYRKSKK